MSTAGLRKVGNYEEVLAAAIKDPSGLTIELREWNNGDGPQFPDWQPEREDVVRVS